jgi:hypothetical protein
LQASLELAKSSIAGWLPVFGYNRLWHETSLELVKALREASESFSWKLQAFLYCLYPRPLVLRHSPKNTLQKFYQFFASLWGTQLGGCSQFNFILFFSLEIPQKKYWDLVELIWGGWKNRNEHKGFKARF